VANSKIFRKYILSVFDDADLSDAQNVSSVESTVREQALDLELIGSSSPVTRSKNYVPLSTVGNSLYSEDISPTTTPKTRKMFTVSNIMST
jgi:hypothetical protein